jgi:hypothetical protein
MEGKNENFDIFNQCQFNDVEDLIDFFPFSNSIENNNEDYKFFIFPDIEPLDDHFNNHKNLMDGDQLLEKINKCEKNYNNIIQNNLIASPTASKIYLIKT